MLVGFLFATAGTVIFKSGTVLKSGVVIKTDFWKNQKFQTIDDWLNSGGTAGEYTGEEVAWSAVSGSPFSNYASINFSADGGFLDLYSGEVKQDSRTGLWWSDITAIDGGGTASTTSNSFVLGVEATVGDGDGTRPTGGNAIGFCSALNTANFGGYNDWYLPTQKELQQAYIDGSANNLARPNYSFWSSTESYSSTADAWYVTLYNGYAPSSNKTNKYYVRCVRR